MGAVSSNEDRQEAIADGEVSMAIRIHVGEKSTGDKVGKTVFEVRAIRRRNAELKRIALKIDALLRATESQLTKAKFAKMRHALSSIKTELERLPKKSAKLSANCWQVVRRLNAILGPPPQLPISKQSICVTLEVITSLISHPLLRKKFSDREDKRLKIRARYLKLAHMKEELEQSKILFEQCRALALRPIPRAISALILIHFDWPEEEDA